MPAPLGRVTHNLLYGNGGAGSFQSLVLDYSCATGHLGATSQVATSRCAPGWPRSCDTCRRPSAEDTWCHLTADLPLALVRWPRTERKAAPVAGCSPGSARRNLRGRRVRRAHRHLFLLRDVDRLSAVGE